MVLVVKIKSEKKFLKIKSEKDGIWQRIRINTRSTLKNSRWEK